MIHKYGRLPYLRLGKLLVRGAKTQAEEKVKFTDSINLPKTKFPARLSANQRATVEESIRQVRTTIDFN